MNSIYDDLPYRTRLLISAPGLLLFAVLTFSSFAHGRVGAGLFFAFSLSVTVAGFAVLVRSWMREKRR